MSTLTKTNDLQKEVVNKIIDSFNTAASEDLRERVYMSLKIYECRDRQQHVVSTLRVDSTVIKNFFESTYLSGVICSERSRLISSKMNKLELPRSIENADVDFLTVLTVLSAMRYYDYKTAAGQMSVLSEFMHWVYA